MIRKYALHIALIFTLSLLPNNAYAQIHNSEIEGKINAVTNSEFIQLIGSAFNKTEISASIRYTLSVIRTDPQTGNRTRNQQEGRLVLEAGQKKNLSQTTIDASETARIIVLLLLYDIDNEIVGKDRIVINGNEADKELAKKTNEKVYVSPDASFSAADGVELRGLILEETKTRPGREFYRMYTDIYRALNINGERVVLIKEELSLANNTKIDVFIGSVKIVEFIVRPQNEYLTQMVEVAIRRTNKYFNDLRSGRYAVKRY